MKYKLIGNNFYVFPLEQVLENRGITKDLFKEVVDKTLEERRIYLG